MKIKKIFAIATVSILCIMCIIQFYSGSLIDFFGPGSKTATASKKSLKTTAKTIANNILRTTVSSDGSDKREKERFICRNQPKIHLLFMKTHKTGSSTVQNVLERYAVKHNIFVGLPKSTNQYTYGKPFNRDAMLSVPANRTVNMIMHHMIFNYKEVSAVLPSDSVYFTILRDPATQFQSAFQYMRRYVASFLRAELPEWISHPEKYFKGRGDGRFWWFGKNNMFFDLGFDNLNEDDAYIQQSIARMEEIYDFVLIAEYFDMSMLLLKDLLCWDMDDVISLSSNARKISKEVNLDLQNKSRAWNKADTSIYRHYNESFWKRVEEYGRERMKRDLAEYQSKKEVLKSFCVEDGTYTNEDIKENRFKVYNPPGMKIMQYKLREEARDNETCVELVLPELSWLARLKKYFYQ